VSARPCICNTTTTTTTTTVLRPFFRDHPGEAVPEENFWTLWGKGRLTEADTLTIRLAATPSGLTSAHLHHPPIFFTGRMPFLPPNQQCQCTEGNQRIGVREKTPPELSSMVLPAASPYRTCMCKPDLNITSYQGELSLAIPSENCCNWSEQAHRVMHY